MSTSESIPLLQWQADPRFSSSATSGFKVADFKVYVGDKIFIKGPSGSGKTVFLKRLILLDARFSDTVQWFGNSISNIEIPHYRTQCLWLPQIQLRTPETLEHWLERRLNPSSKLYTRRRNYFFEGINQVLGFESDQVFNKKTQTFSGGEWQAIVLSTALALEPTLLILDEAMSAMDEELEKRTWQQVQSYLENLDQPRALIWTSHHPNFTFLKPNHEIKL